MRISLVSCGLLAVVIGSAPLSAQTKPADVPACSLLTLAEIKSAGRAVPVVTNLNGSMLPKGGSECAFPGTVTVQLDRYPVASFDAARRGLETGAKMTFTPMTGVGDAAYYFEQGPSSMRIAGILLRAGTHTLSVTISINADANNPDANRKVLTALAKTALSKVK